MFPNVRWTGRRFLTNSVRVTLTSELDLMQDVYAQRFSSSGEKIGTEFIVNQFRDFNQRSPAIAALNSGGFVLAWSSEQQREENSVGIYARVFDAAGNGGNE